MEYGVAESGQGSPGEGRSEGTKSVPMTGTKQIPIALGITAMALYAIKAKRSRNSKNKEESPEVGGKHNPKDKIEIVKVVRENLSGNTCDEIIFVRKNSYK